MEKKRKPSHMKGKKFSPEHLEARRQKKAEREERWRLSREGRIAKESYHNFMKAVQWLTHAKKEDFVLFLKNAVESEEINYNLLVASCKNRLNLHDGIKDDNKRWANLQESIAINNEAGDRFRALCAGKVVLKFFEHGEVFYKPGEGMWKREPNYVHSDFSMYCRDN